MIKLGNGWPSKFQGHLLSTYKNIQQRIPTSHQVLPLPCLSFSISLTFSHGSKFIFKIMKPYILEGSTFFFNHLTLEKVFLRVTYLEDCFGCYLPIILLGSCHCMGPNLLMSHRTGPMANRGISVIFMGWLKARRTGKRVHHPSRVILSPSMGYDIQTLRVFYFWVLNH